MNRKPTYAELFAVLEGLDFEAISGAGEIAYLHRPTDTLLLFSPADGTSAVTSADLASVQIRLEHNGLIDRPLDRLLAATSPAGRHRGRSLGCEVDRTAC